MTRVNNNTTSTTFFDERFSTTLRLSSGVPSVMFYQQVMIFIWHPRLCVICSLVGNKSFLFHLLYAIDIILVHHEHGLLFLFTRPSCWLRLEHLCTNGSHFLLSRFSKPGHNLSFNVSTLWNLFPLYSKNGWLSWRLGYMLGFFLAIMDN
jgi:hypothetical protein